MLKYDDLGGHEVKALNFTSLQAAKSNVFWIDIDLLLHLLNVVN